MGQRMAGLTPVSSRVPTLPLSHLCRGTGRKQKEGKKTHGLGWRQFNRWSKNCAHKQSKMRHLFTVSHRQADVSHSLGSWVSVYVVVTREDKGRNSEHSLFLLLFLIFDCWHHMAWNIPLIRWGQLSPLSPLSASCPSPVYLLGGGVRKRESVEPVPALPQQHSKHWCVISLVFVTNPNHSTIQAAVMEIFNSIPARPSRERNPEFELYLRTSYAFWCFQWYIPLSTETCIQSHKPLCTGNTLLPANVL